MDVPKIDTALVARLVRLKEDLAEAERAVSKAAMDALGLEAGEIVMHNGLQYKVERVTIGTHDGRVYTHIVCHRWWHTKAQLARAATWFAPGEIGRMK
jgi:hypothetical protein